MDPKNLEKLSEYADLSNDEVGEAINIMMELLNYESVLSTKLMDALLKELEAQYSWFSENTKIVERKKTITRAYDVLERI